jgi:beta-aspartyl-peptidase (threonine type)
VSGASLILANAEIHDDVIADGAARLRSGAGAADVAERIARAAEEDPDEHTVGYGGWPNLLGEVELDASFMDGATRRAGAVAGLRGFAHPISVARAAMEQMPHVLLCGKGAEHFASAIGAETRDMLSPEARAAWITRLRELGVVAPSAPDPEPPLDPMTVHNIIGTVRRAIGLREGGDTMNVIVRDLHGNIASAVTTSGVAWKHPGRVGDSPLIGAGNYADNRFGAATCMGWGEIAIRTGAARSAVLLMETGRTPAQAAEAVVRDMRELCTDGLSVRLLVLGADGTPAAAASHPGIHWKLQRASDPAPRTMESAVPR